MKNRFICIVAILIFSTVFLVAENGNKVIISMNAWEPIKSETEPYGVLAQITKEAFALEGIEVEFRVAPWKRGYDNVKEGVWHGIVGWNRTDEREKLFYVSTPLILEDVVFFHHRDLELDWNAVDDLEGLTVGMISGYNYGPELSRAIENGLVGEETTKSEEQSILMLQRKRLDIWPCEVDVGLHLINTYLTPDQAQDLTFHPNPIQVSDLCMLFSRSIPGNYIISLVFERGLSRLSENGRLREIVEEFLPGFQSLQYID